MSSIEKECSLDRSKKEIIRFGIQSGLELLVNLITSLIILYVMDMFIEGIFFFIVFIPIRIFSGGYHADTFFRCWILSSATVFLVLEMADKFALSEILNFIGICILIVAIWSSGAVVNDNRPVSQKEYKKFLKKLHITLSFQVVLAAVIIKMEETVLINILIFSLMVNLLSLMIGRIKYRNNN